MNIITLDKNIFILVNSFVGKVAFFDSLIQLIVNEYFVPATLALVVLYLWFAPGKNQEKHQEALILAFCSLITVNLVIKLSNLFIFRERPFEALPTKLLFYKPTDPPFPSNAAAVGFVLATAILIVNRRIGIWAMLLAAFYAFSRVYAGVHFPSDVAAGAALGFLVTFLISRYTKLIKGSTNLTRKIQKILRLELD